MVAADASHALQDSPQRDHHWREVLANAPAQGNAQEQEMREGAQMRAARWALDDRDAADALRRLADRKSTRLNSSHLVISYAVFCLKKKNTIDHRPAGAATWFLAYETPVTPFCRK